MVQQHQMAKIPWEAANCESYRGILCLMVQPQPLFLKKLFQYYFAWLHVSNIWRPPTALCMIVQIIRQCWDLLQPPVPILIIVWFPSLTYCNIWRSTGSNGIENCLDDDYYNIKFNQMHPQDGQVMIHSSRQMQFVDHHRDRLWP